MDKRRVERVNSLLKEVIADVIRLEVKDPHIPVLLTVTAVVITPDLQYAKVHISVIGNTQQKDNAVKALNRAAGFIAQAASKEVRLRYFPALTFVIDDSLDHQIHIEKVIRQIHDEEQKRVTNERAGDD